MPRKSGFRSPKPVWCCHAAHPDGGRNKLQFKGIARKGPKFLGGPTEPQMRWNFVLHSLRRLLFPLRPKLARAACSNKGLRSDNRRRSEQSAKFHRFCVSVRGFRNFGPFSGSVSIFLVCFTCRLGPQCDLDGTLYILSVLQGLDG